MESLPDIRTVYPRGETERYWCESDYDPMVKSFGHEVLLSNMDGDYQGDSRYLLRRADGTYGVLVISWGSCSGCDALQACGSYEDIDALRTGILRDIRWTGDAAATLAYITSEDRQLSSGWYHERAEAVAFVRDASAILEGVQS